MKRLFTLSLGWAIVSTLVAQSSPQPDARMLRYPDVSDTEITFVYAEDVWIVPKTGGVARRLTSAKGPEAHVKFSPDGKHIAFTGNYQGNLDIYTMTHQGGDLKRLTYHPLSDKVMDWHPSGERILFASSRKSPSSRFNQFYTISIDGGQAEDVPLFYAERGSYSPDGNKLAYQFLDNTLRTWKRYQGGLASDLWIYDFEKAESEQITSYKGSDDLPMWHDEDIYFLSDRGPKYKLNLWVYHTPSKTFEQITFFDEYDVKFPSIGPRDIVFENGGSLYVYSIENQDIRKVEISVPAENLQELPEFKDAQPNVFSYWISPTGKRALFDARGELFTVPAEHGITQNLTQTSGAAEHHPHWSPDGKSIAYFSDAAGEYNLYIRNADGSGKPKKITQFTKDFYSGTQWSPDSKKIAFHDQKGNLYILFVASQEVIKASKSDMFEIDDYSWSPDSRWLVYSKASAAAIFNTEIWVYNVEGRKETQLTNGFYRALHPVFSLDGNYLFYVSSRSFSPTYSNLDATWIYGDTEQILAVPLLKTTPSLLKPLNDIEEMDDEQAETTEKEKGKKPKDSKGTADEEELKVEIDAEAFESRACILPVPAANFNRLIAVEGKLVFTKQNSGPVSARAGSDAMYYSYDERETALIISGINGLEISTDGKKMIYSHAGTYGIIDVSKGQEPGTGKLDLSGMKVKINPRAEWTQIFNEAWRIERDFFYDPNMHGLDWKAIGERYRKLLPFCATRGDVNYIIGEMIGELNVGHAYVWGGDNENADKVSVGLLGAEFELVEGVYQIKEILKGSEMDPDIVSPLSDPSLHVSVGDYILAVNQKEILPDQSIYAAFQNTGGKLIQLTLNSNPSMEGARTVEVKTLTSEGPLRNRAWIEENRQQVLDATDGRCGYIYVPNTGIDGQNELVRQFQGQTNMQALIIDERFNAGGQIPDRFIELLNRPLYNYFGRREMESWPTPFVSNTGPKVMIANEWAGSGGDAFPYYFQKAGLGPVVGKRTWGGLVGISDFPVLVDGGVVTAPNFGIYSNEGEWTVEGYGVDPDVEVTNKPEQVYHGQDNQLNKAIELINEALKNKIDPPQKPAYPVKTGIGND